MYDLKIVNGIVVDLDTGLCRVSDVAITDGKIVDIGACTESAQKIIDASGKIVSAGFVDIHMHEDDLNKNPVDAPYDIADDMLRMGVTTATGGNCGLNYVEPVTFFDFVDKNGSPINYCLTIGQNYLRDEVGNTDWYRKSTKDEIIKMTDIANRALEKGCVGVSLGFEYCPGVDYDETISFLEGLKKEDLFVSCHFRKDGPYAVEAIEEMISITRDTRCKFQISHIGSCAAYGMMADALAPINAARAAGLDISADCYPYAAFSTKIGTAAFDDGCFDNWKGKTYSDIMLTADPYAGVYCDEELYYKVRKEYPEMNVVAFVMDEDDVALAYKQDWMIVASDGLLAKNQGHPRASGTFPRVLGKYVRDEKVLTLSQALDKMTRMPAKRLGLATKGELKVGFDADITIFDADTIIDGATFEQPVLPPKGIEYVIIAGTVAVEGTKIVSDRLGKALRL
jgi:N-acyl-D-amino-acid deacylase